MTVDRADLLRGQPNGTRKGRLPFGSRPNLRDFLFFYEPINLLDQFVSSGTLQLLPLFVNGLM